MRRRLMSGVAIVAILGVFPAGVGSAPPLESQEAGIPAQIVDFTPDLTVLKSYPTVDHTDPEGPRQGSTEWRVVVGTGNAAEVWLTATKEGRLLDLGGRYINYSDDLGQTWKSVRPLEPLVNAEGSVVVAPGGDLVAVTWDPYSGDRVLNYKYSAADKTWYYTYNPIHTVFWDRPGIRVAPGPFQTPLGTVPYITWINGLPHDPWYYSVDGLNYPFVSSPARERGLTSSVQALPEVKGANEWFDWMQPNLDPILQSTAALGEGRLLHGTSSIFMPEDLKWHPYSLPSGATLSGRTHTDSRGRLHSVISGGGGFTYRISSDAGRTWNSLFVPGGSPGDFKANAAAGVAAVWQIQNRKDHVVKIDITTDEPKLMRRYEVGLGDDPRSGGIGFYGISGGHRFDFSSIVVFADGRVAVSFMDSTTKMKFPTLATDVVSPAVAIELDTTLPGSQ
ncbi:MAG: hypothetical protein M3245_02005 [Actinomycetota bacterium]|nr:hypothetical protein [Actinomycetota bacterium]